MTPRLSTALAFAAALLFPAAPVLAEKADAGAYLAARSAMLGNDYAEATMWFARALIADPRNPALLEGAVLAFLRAGDPDRAAEVARRLIATGGRSLAASLALTTADAMAGDYAAILEGLPQRPVGNLLDRLVQAWAEFGEGRMSDAVATFDAIATGEGLKAFGLYHKALALAAVGDFEGAEEILSGRAAGPLTVNRRGVVAHVQILTQLERWEDAADMIDRSFGADPDPEMAALRARVAARESVPFSVAATAREGLAEAIFTVGLALNGEAEDDYTLLYARSAAAIDPGNVEARLLVASLLERVGQFRLAAAEYAAIAPDHPAFVAAELGRANALYAAGDREAALDILARLAREMPESLQVRLAEADALRREERFDEAIAAYSAVLALLPEARPEHWRLYYARGIAYERTGRWAEAEADFRKSLELDGGQPQVLNYLGYGLVDRGEKLDEALGMIEKAVAARPDSGYIVDSLAWALFRLGRYDEALEPMERASLLEPVDPIVTDHLGDVYWAVGRRLEARFQWRRALSFEPEEKEAVRIRRKLEIGLDAVLAEEGAAPLRKVDGVTPGN